MNNQAQAAAARFHAQHTGKTWAGHTSLDPWLRDVLVALSASLTTMAKQVDRNSDRLDQIERRMRQSRP